MNRVPTPGRSLLNRSGYSLSFLLVTLITIIPMTIMGYLLSAEVDGRIQRLNSEQLGLRYIGHIRPLIELIPQLLTDPSKAVGDYRSSVDAHFNQLNLLDQRIGGALQTGQQLEVLTHEWHNLSPKLPSLSQQQLFKQQTQLITGLVALIAQVADSSGLIIDTYLETHLLMELIVKQIPILTEALRQAAAVAPTLPSRGLNPLPRDQLVSQLTRIHASEQKIHHNITVASVKNPGLQGSLLPRDNAVTASVGAFTQQMQQWLADESIPITTAELHQRTIAAQQSIFLTFDTIVTELERLLDERLQQELQNQRYTLLLMLATLLLVLAVSATFFRQLNRFKTTLDLTHEALFLFSPTTLRLFYINQSAIQQLGYSKPELQTMTLAQLQPGYDENQLRQLLAPLLKGLTQSITVETTHRHRDGHLFPVEISLQYIRPRGEPARFMAIVRNISDRVAAAARLQEIEARNRLLLESVGEGIIGVDTEGTAIFINPSACDMLGYSAEELIGQQTHQLIHHSHADGSPYPHQQCPVYAAFVKGTRQQVDDEVFWRKDGSSLPVSYTSTPIEDKGRFIGSVVAFRDISARLQTEQAMIAAKVAAERANLAKSEFLSSMSHELRTPMNAILGFGQLLAFDDNLNPEQRDQVQEIITAGHHLLNLINEVLDLAKVESGRIELTLEPVALYPVIEASLGLVTSLANKHHIQLHHHGVQGAIVRADRTRLKQVLLNLLSNAIKYNRKGGSVTITLPSAGGAMLRLQVTDTGPGIPAASLGALFEPFNRLKAEHSNIEGTGIGLTITRRIIELMGGRIGVESQVGVGSSFWIDLPVATLPSHSGTPEEMAPPPTTETVVNTTTASATHRTILYIEDNPANLKLVARLFSQHPQARLLTAHTPKLGLELAQARHPDLILLDINMPGMDGYQLLQLLQADESLKGIPVIAVTANAMPRDIERGRAAGFRDYLTKPLDIARFHRVIQQHLNTAPTPPHNNRATTNE